MAKGFLRSIQTYVKNVGVHILRLATRRESAGDALTALSRDAKKVSHSATRQAKGSQRREAMRLTEKGRKAYNEKRDEAAAEAFHQAVMIDSNYALPYTYLGYVMYRQGRLSEAVNYWNRAIVAEPSSDGARKARRRLQRVAVKKNEMNEWIENRHKES